MANTYVRVDASKLEERRQITTEEYETDMRRVANERLDAIAKYEDLLVQLDRIKSRALVLNDSFVSKVAAYRAAGYPDPSWLEPYTTQYPNPSWMV